MKANLPEVNYTEEMRAITDYFGNAKFNGKILNMIYDRIKGLHIDQFKKVIEEILMNGGYAPKPNDFVKLAEPFLAENRLKQKEKESEMYRGMFTSEQLKDISKGLQKGIDGNPELIEKINQGLMPLNKALCKHCNDTGYVWAKEINKPHKADIGFNCFCRASKNDPRFQTWGRRYFEDLINKNQRSVA